MTHDSCWKCLGSGVLGSRGQYVCHTCQGTGKSDVPPDEEEDIRQPDAGHERLHGKLPEGRIMKIKVGQLRKLIRESISTSASPFKKGDVVEITTGVKRGLATKPGLVAFVNPQFPDRTFVLVASPSTPWKKPRISDSPWIEAYANEHLQPAPDQKADWMNDANLKRAIDQWASIENGPEEVVSWYWTNYDDYADVDPEAEGPEMPDELYEKLLAFRDEIFKTGVVPA